MGTNSRVARAERAREIAERMRKHWPAYMAAILPLADSEQYESEDTQDGTDADRAPAGQG